MRAESLSEQLFFATARLEARGPGRDWVGTGFVFGAETTDGTAHFLVSNKHVFNGAESLTVTMIRATADGEPQLGKATRVTITGFGEGSWLGHPDPLVDVGVMPLGPVLDNMRSRGAAPFFRSIGMDLVVDSSTAAEFDAVENVTFVGYPSGLYDTHNFLPIARRGTTATPIAVDYGGAPAFLIDASVFPGSSGSPVFMLDQGSYATRNGVVVGSRIHFLGLLAAVHTRAVEGTVSAAPTALVASFDEPIDLGIVFRAETVVRCVADLLERVGLSLAVNQDLVSTDMEPSPADELVGDARDDRAIEDQGTTVAPEPPETEESSS